MSHAILQVVKLSDFLPWAQKKAAGAASKPAGDRRSAPRRVTDGAGWVYWADDAGKACRSRVSFLDVSEDSSGIGFLANRTAPEGFVSWALPDGGKALPCDIKHIEKTEKGYRIGASLKFQDRYLEGSGGTRVLWVNDDRVLLSVPATVRNTGQGLIEVSLPFNVPARRMIYLEGPRYGCLAVCRGARPDGDRFILVTEAASDSFLSAAAAA